MNKLLSIASDLTEVIIPILPKQYTLKLCFINYRTISNNGTVG